VHATFETLCLAAAASCGSWWQWQLVAACYLHALPLLLLFGDSCNQPPFLHMRLFLLNLTADSLKAAAAAPASLFDAYTLPRSHPVCPTAAASTRSWW
jgi:hypothetical protein